MSEENKTENEVVNFVDVTATPDKVRGTFNDVIDANNTLRVRNYGFLNAVMAIPLSSKDASEETGEKHPWELEMTVFTKTKPSKAIDLYSKPQPDGSVSDALTRKDIRQCHLHRVINYVFGFSGKDASTKARKHFEETLGIEKSKADEMLLDVLQVYYWHYALKEKHGAGLFCTKKGEPTDYMVTNRELDPDTFEVIAKKGEKKTPKTFSIYVNNAVIDPENDLAVDRISTTKLIEKARSHFSTNTSGDEQTPIQKACNVITKRLEETDNQKKPVPISSNDEPSAKKLVNMIVSDGRFDKLLTEALIARQGDKIEAFEKAFTFQSYTLKLQFSKKKYDELQALAQAQSENVPAVNK